MSFILDILRGMIIGIANIIPGVSGGTMMVSMGIYDKIIGSINGIFKDIKKSIRTLLPYVIGMLMAIALLAKVITLLLANFPIQTEVAFIGLVLGSIPVILSKVKGKPKGIASAIAFVCCFALIIVLQVIGEGNTPDAVLTLSPAQLLILFLMGVISSAAMVIPGVSGSMMLMLLGYYNPVVGSISRLLDALGARNIGEILQCVGTLLPFGIGVIVGILVIAKLIEMLLQSFPGPTYFGIMGLVAASPLAILMSLDYSGITPIVVIISIVTFACGFLAAYKLGGD